MNYDIDDLLEEYGNEFLIETRRQDDALYPMDELESLLPSSLTDAFTMGWRSRNQFRWTDSYVTFDGYGNLVSIPKNEYLSYLANQIDEDEFVEWCIEQGYIDEDED